MGTTGQRAASPQASLGMGVGVGAVPLAGNTPHPAPGFAAAPKAAETLLATLVSSAPKMGLE